MPACTLYKRIFAQLLLLCVCIAAGNSCPNRKFIKAEARTAASQRIDIAAAESGQSICSAEILRDGFYEVFKTGGKASPAAVLIGFSLNLLNNAPGTVSYLPPKPRSVLETDPFPLFLKNGVLLV